MNIIEQKKLLIEYNLFLLERNLELVGIVTGEKERAVDMIIAFLENDEEEEELSACCGSPFYSDSDICTQCKEHG